MEHDNNIKIFTATDIEKYHKGLLSPKEMHDLEKAALDDPFLADAIEGYASPSNGRDDIADLKKRLSEKTEQAKVIPLATGGRSSFPWLRAAVALIFIAGAGLLTYQFLFKKKESSIAEVSRAPETKPGTSIPKVDSVTSIGSSVSKATDSPGYKSGSSIQPDKPKDVVMNNTNKLITKDTLNYTEGISATNAPPAATKETITEVKTPAEPRQQADLERKADISFKDAPKNSALNKPVLRDDAAQYYSDNAKSKSVNGAMNKRAEDSHYSNPVLFRGRVTDASNNALPFANITNRGDNVGTYSDAQGYFTLVSPDSVLYVQVRSVGFENNNVQLRGLSSGYNPIVMQEDRSLSAQILDTVKRNFRRVPGNTMTFEEPEPEDGWGAYRSYVVNNLNVPETFDTKKTGETADNAVEVSFEVNNNGDPVNIKVEKSLCDKCDKEAIRLIKDGPKWKRKTKKGKRTTVTVPFIKP